MLLMDKHEVHISWKRVLFRKNNATEHGCLVSPPAESHRGVLQQDSTRGTEAINAWLKFCISSPWYWSMILKHDTEKLSAPMELFIFSKHLPTKSQGHNN